MSKHDDQLNSDIQAHCNEREEVPEPTEWINNKWMTKKEFIDMINNMTGRITMKEEDHYEGRLYLSMPFEQGELSE